METAALSPLTRPARAPRPATLRSRVTNGKRHHVTGDGRGPWGRRWRDLYADITDQVIADTGADLSATQTQLIRRATSLALLCEQAEAKAADGEQIDLLAFGQMVDRFHRVLSKLGMKKGAPHQAAPSLADYLAARPNTTTSAAGRSLAEMQVGEREVT